MITKVFVHHEATWMYVTETALNPSVSDWSKAPDRNWIENTWMHVCGDLVLCHEYNFLNFLARAKNKASFRIGIAYLLILDLISNSILFLT